MKLKVYFGVVALFLSLPTIAQLRRNYPVDRNSFVFGQMLYAQDLRNDVPDTYPEWSPGDAACPLHSTNVLGIASQTVTSLVLNAAVDPDRMQLTLFEREGLWFYDVQLGLLATNGAPASWSRKVNMIIGIDGKVPKMTRRPYEGSTIKRRPRQASPQPEISKADANKRILGGGFRRSVPKPDGDCESERELTPEEQAQKREEVRENLREYQMAVIRAGMPPLPIPLTAEMDDKLVEEGILPPAETNKSLDATAVSTHSIPDSAMSD